MTATVFVVTPSFNAASTIDRTIQSVLSQAGDVRIRYHVQDGGSTDGTIERLGWWRDMLAAGAVRRHCHGVKFTFASAPDQGMYDAIVRGFSAIGAPDSSFMTWINADDILMPGALAFAGAMEKQFAPSELSWFGGAVCVLRDDMITASFDRPIPRDALRLGVCDGVHWDCLQQEGTFFRRWLWNSVDPARSIAEMKLAGDWNLWRLMAATANFSQVAPALGGFRISEGQMSAKYRDFYLQEISAIVPEEERTEAFRRLCETGPLKRRRLHAVSGSNVFQIVDGTANGFALYRWRERFGSPPTWENRPELAPAVVATGRSTETSRLVNPDEQEFPSISSFVIRRAGLIALDLDWQFPAITEKHAFDRMCKAELPPNGAVYVGYPWATLIDKLQNKAFDRDLHIDRFDQFCDLLPQNSELTTVCQHIHAKIYADLFRRAGIRTVFWSHATVEDVVEAPRGLGAVRFLPFPLYPVQVPELAREGSVETDHEARPYLYSFVGARANEHYLTEARNWILDSLAADARGLIVGRDSWHYQRVVYDLQVLGRPGGSQAQLIDDAASDLFKGSLLKSTFSLCPSGTGPNSIRLWESIGAGAIPVIISDTWAPPGPRRLWERAAVFCEETPTAVGALPDRLAEIAADPARLTEMRHAMRQLWLLFGPECFVYDVHQFLLSHAGGKLLNSSDVARDLPPLPVAMTAVAGAADVRDLLLAWSSHLVLQPDAAVAAIEANPSLDRMLDNARTVGADPALREHLPSVLTFARKRAGAATPLPAIARGIAPKVALLGKHSHRTPLSYPSLRRLIGDRVEWAQTLEHADLIVTGFNVDLRENIGTLRPLLERSASPKLAVVSEEPLWDVTWSGPFSGRDGRLTVDGTELRYAFLGHETSHIYDFNLLPYFVLTEDCYPVRYASLMDRYANITPAELLERWLNAPVSAAFFAEKRDGDAAFGGYPDRDVTRLSGYRSSIAELSRTPSVLRVGKGWGAGVKRQDLPDWHLDKLACLDGRVRMATAYENVHQRNYVTEKIFDAFAVGGIPVYWAGAEHRVFELVPETAMLNTFGLDPPTAAQRIESFAPDRSIAESWIATCVRLAALFRDFSIVTAERQRVADAVVEEVLALV